GVTALARGVEELAAGGAGRAEDEQVHAGSPPSGAAKGRVLDAGWHRWLVAVAGRVAWQEQRGDDDQGCEGEGEPERETERVGQQRADDRHGIRRDGGDLVGAAARGLDT